MACFRFLAAVVFRVPQILKAHPEINKLMGPCPNTKYQIAFVVSLQVTNGTATNDDAPLAPEVETSGGKTHTRGPLRCWSSPVDRRHTVPAVRTRARAPLGVRPRSKPPSLSQRAVEVTA
jgi:hypothetical protein